MDGVSDDPDTIEDFKEIAKTLHLPPQTVAIIFFAVFTVVCMGISLGCWYMHHRYAEAQKRATLPALERGTRPKASLPQMSMAKHRRNASTTSSTRGLLPARPERAVVLSRGTTERVGRTNSSVTLVDPTFNPISPERAGGRTSKTYSLALLDFYATLEDDLHVHKGIPTSRSEIFF